MFWTEHFCCTGHQKRRQLPREGPAPPGGKSGENTRRSRKGHYWVSIKGNSPSPPPAPPWRRWPALTGRHVHLQMVSWALRISQQRWATGLLHFLEFKYRLSEEEIKTRKHWMVYIHVFKQCIYTYTGLCTQMHIYMYIYMYIYIYTQNMYLYMCACVYIHIRTYIYMYVHTQNYI